MSRPLCLRAAEPTEGILGRQRLKSRQGDEIDFSQNLAKARAAELPCASFAAR
jgi:hypothetical protein